MSKTSLTHVWLQPRCWMIFLFWCVRASTEWKEFTSCALLVKRLRGKTCRLIQKKRKKKKRKTRTKGRRKEWRRSVTVEDDARAPLLVTAKSWQENPTPPPPPPTLRTEKDRQFIHVTIHFLYPGGFIALTGWFPGRAAETNGLLLVWLWHCAALSCQEIKKKKKEENCSIRGIKVQFHSPFLQTCPLPRKLGKSSRALPIRCKKWEKNVRLLLTLSDEVKFTHLRSPATWLGINLGAEGLRESSNKQDFSGLDGSWHGFLPFGWVCEAAMLTCSKMEAFCPFSHPLNRNSVQVSKQRRNSDHLILSRLPSGDEFCFHKMLVCPPCVFLTWFHCHLYPVFIASILLRGHFRLSISQLEAQKGAHAWN